MKKIIGFILTAALLTGALTGCGNTTPEDDSTSSPGSTSQTQTSDAGKVDAPITVISREDGSGTRGAFVELLEIVEEQNGEDVDLTIDGAEITSSTAVMMTTVAGDPNAIGYISLGSLNETVKALKIDGAEATVENINNGSYPISRPFNIATKGDISEVAQDFINFIMSKEGQDIVEDAGYIRIQDTGAFSSENPSGKVVVAGSSSVTPVMEALKEAYVAINTGAEIEVQQSDSTTGMNSAIEGICDIGMASRAIKDSELEQGLTGMEIAKDGIAVIVNNDNPIDGLTSAQVKDIYIGNVSNWSELS